jgi:hypothetical protein
LHPNSVCRVHPIFAECELPLLGPAGALPTVGGRNTFSLLGCVASRAVGGDTQGLITNATKNRQPRKLAMLELTPLSGALGSRGPRVGPVTPPGFGPSYRTQKGILRPCGFVVSRSGSRRCQQIAFTEHFGKVEPHPLRTRRSVEGYPGVLILENQPGKPGARNDYWHSDISHAERPPLATLQRRASACSAYCP